jgi:hypothetical protein
MKMDVMNVESGAVAGIVKSALYELTGMTGELVNRLRFGDPASGLS